MSNHITAVLGGKAEKIVSFVTETLPRKYPSLSYSLTPAYNDFLSVTVIGPKVSMYDFIEFVKSTDMMVIFNPLDNKATVSKSSISDADRLAAYLSHIYRSFDINGKLYITSTTHTSVSKEFTNIYWKSRHHQTNTTVWECAEELMAGFEFINDNTVFISGIDPSSPIIVTPQDRILLTLIKELLEQNRPNTVNKSNSF